MLAQRAVGRDAAADGEPVEAGLREPRARPAARSASTIARW